MADVRALQFEIESKGARLIVVSKTHPVKRILDIYIKGIRDFGENKVQEMVEKQPLLPPDIRWHLIGHLQTNKVKYVAPFVHMIHTVDSPKLLAEIEKQAAKNKRRIRTLFQFHIAQEDSKYGMNPAELDWLYALDFTKTYPHIIPCGVMGMATFTEDEMLIRSEFQTLNTLFQRLKQEVFFSAHDSFTEISMGMSSDYAIALEEGATLVRIGSMIFGSRTTSV